MKVTLIETFRAMFYAPFYAAEALGAYQAEGVEVEMKTSSASAQTLSTLTSGGGEVSWGGPMRIMLALDRNRDAGAAAFCKVIGPGSFFPDRPQARSGLYDVRPPGYASPRYPKCPRHGSVCSTISEAPA
jgi:hypothetical protein